MIKLPQPSWTQPNTSDKLGSLYATKNINLDEAGYIKLSPRTVAVFTEDDNGDFGIPHSIGQFDTGSFQVGTTSDANFVASISPTSIDVSEDTGTNNPDMALDSSARFWQSRWHASTATTVVSKGANDDANDPWTSRITGLTSGLKHFLEVFDSRNSLVVLNGNVAKQYDTAYANTVDLTIPSDFEMVKCAYNNGKLGIITRSGNSTTGQLIEAKFYLWDGSTTSAKGWNVGSDACMDIVALKSSFAVLTRAGQWKFFNGGGFDDIASLPFFSDDKIWNDTTPSFPTGDSIAVDGDVAYLNLGLELSQFAREQYQQIPNAPSGVWCGDQKVGLYHRWSPSISRVAVVQVTTVDTSLDILTASGGSVPATGDIARYVRKGTTGIGGLALNRDYFIIKHTATTFSLALTKADAVAGNKVDLTIQDGDVSYFHTYDLVDYGNSYAAETGAVAILADTNALYRDILIGGSYPNTVLNERDTLCMAVPFLENRGWVMTPKIFASGPTDQFGPLGVKFRPLKANDAILVKARTRNVLGLPISAPNEATSDFLTWSSSTLATTDTDLSVAKAHLDNGGVLELELVAGAGGGQMVQITAIAENAGTYSVTVVDEVLGAFVGRKSYFIIDNWQVLGTITSSDSDYVEIEAPDAGTWVQYKIELRGSDTCIEELQVNPTTHQGAPTLSL